MEAIKIAVCDDEKNIRSYICSLVRKQGVECEVTEYATAEDYFLAGADHDLLFLDIELKGPDSSMDGMEMAKRIRGMEDIKQPIIIFVTGYEKYVYDAFVKPKQVGEHPIPGAESVLLADVAVDQQPDFF